MQTTTTAIVSQPTSSFNQFPDDALIRQKQLLQMNVVPFSATTLWRKINSGLFPQPIKVSEAITAWRVSEVRAWLVDPQNYGGNHD